MIAPADGICPLFGWRSQDCAIADHKRWTPSAEQRV